MTHYYVYYRIDPARLSSLRGEVASLLQKLEQCCGIRGRWLRRRDDPNTYMEVYESVVDGQAFEAALERESAALGLDRRIERFIACDPCA